MLIVLITILLLGGSSGTGLLDYIGERQGAIDVAVSDADRRRAAVNVVKRMKQSTEARNKMVSKAASDISAVLDRSAVAYSELDVVWEALFQGIDRHNRDLLDLRFELKQHMSEAEWSVVFSDSGE